MRNFIISIIIICVSVFIRHIAKNDDFLAVRTGTNETVRIDANVTIEDFANNIFKGGNR